MTQREPLPPINFAALADALLARAHQLVPAWCPGGAQRGHEYVCGSVQGGAGDSCAINLSTGKWGDFASDERGNDLVSLYAACFDLPMGKAAVQVAREEGLEDVAGVQPARDAQDAPKREPRPVPVAVPHRAEPEGWKTMVPVPPHAPAPTFKHQYRTLEDIEHTAAYQMDGQLLGFVVRFRTSDGGKETLPYTWCTSAKDGASRWHWRQWDEPRPLYVPAQTLPAGRTVIMVEGEKKADILHALLEAHAPGVYLVASWPGGCKAWKKALWDWLKGCTVLLWPDCDGKHEVLTKTERESCTGPDEDAVALARAVLQQAKPLLPAHKQPGMAAMLGIGALLRAEHGCTVQLLPIPEPGTVADGWDCADAINTDGWDADKVLAFFARAHALPAADGAEAPAAAGGGGSGGGGGKKIDGPVGTGGSDDAGGAGAGVREIPWWLEPYYDAGKGRWLTSRKLVIAALEHDPLLCNVLGINQLSNNIDARLAWPWLHGKAGPITGAVDLMLGGYLTKSYGLPSIPRAALMEAIETVAHGRPFHPIRLWLEGLKHDGKARIDSWLIYALGESPDSLAPAVCEYLRLVGRYWLLGMVNRVMQPGCKFDYCPVLEGPGGYRKSTLVEALAGTPFFSDTHFDVGRGKEGQEQVQGLWMYEIAELANFGKAEIGLIKAFITAKVDRYRPSYGRVVESFERQCVLAGTTNESTYLRDRTGNRRFWPIPVKKVININFVIRFREQLFAEAYALYLTGAAYTPSHQDELRLFVPMQESRLVETAVISEMMNVLTRTGKTEGPSALVNCMTEFVTIAQMCLALGVDAAKSSPAVEAQIRSFFDHEGWDRVKKQINGVRAHGWARPAVWPKVEAEEAMEAGPQAVAAPISAAGNFNQEQDADDAPF
jgi:putative DNA primase/helicase